MNNEVKTVLTILIVILLFIIATLYSLYILFFKHPKQEEEKEKTQAQLIYNKCCNLKINDFNNIKNLKLLSVIASSYGVENLETAKKLYDKGKSIIEKETLGKNQK